MSTKKSSKLDLLLKLFSELKKKAKIFLHLFIIFKYLSQEYHLKYLNDQSKGQLKKELIENLHEQHPEFFPNQSRHKNNEDFQQIKILTSRSY